MPRPSSIALVILIAVATGPLSGFANAGDPIPGLIVKAVTLCKRVNDIRDPQGEFDYDATVAHGPVSLWTVLSGNNATLNELERRGMLPIRHRWLFADVLSFEEVGAVDQLSDQEPIRVGTITQLKKLRGEAATQGDFDWRTWSCKQALRPGIYVVEVIFNNGSPVLDPDGKPCQARFKYEPRD